MRFTQSWSFTLLVFSISIFSTEQTNDLNTSKNSEIFHNLGKLYKQQDRIDEAIKAYEHALQLKPDDLTMLIEVGNLHNIINQNEKALKYYLQALEINPNLYAVMYNFGYTLKKMGHIQEAMAVYQKILEKKPDYAHAHFSLALSYLTLGDWKQGWPAYEWRWAVYKESPKKFDSPIWDGSDLHGKTILVYAEQGIGDTFQFIRYTQQLKEKGAHVIFQTQNVLAQLLSNCPYLDSVIKRNTPVPEHDYHIALMSLPMLFKTRLDTVPEDIPYLYPDTTLVTYWHDQLKKDTNFKIGICWQGNAQYTTQSLRHAVATKSCSVKYFEPLAKLPGVSLYSLQKINGTEQLAAIKDSFVVHELGPDFDESHGRFMDTAAVINNLDLVVTVDTSIGHLAGALGAKVWVLLPKPADWRWLLDRTDTPWYKTMRLFRQKKPGDWDGIMQTVCAALQPDIFFDPIENNIAIEEIMDQISIYSINSNQALSSHTSIQNLEKRCEQYKEKIPALISLARLLHNVNVNLEKLSQKITAGSYDVFGAQYADIAHKIYNAHTIKNQIKKKIRNIIEQFKKEQ